jgi:hypothetical protein
VDSLAELFDAKNQAAISVSDDIAVFDFESLLTSLRLALIFRVCFWSEHE